MSTGIICIICDERCAEFGDKLSCIIAERGFETELRTYDENEELRFLESGDKQIYVGTKSLKQFISNAGNDDKPWVFDRYGCHIGLSGNECILWAKSGNLHLKDYTEFEKYCREISLNHHDVVVPHDNLLFEMIESAKDVLRFNESRTVEKAQYGILFYEFVENHLDDFLNRFNDVENRASSLIKLQNGIAAIDAITLKMAAAEAEKSGYAVTYPDVYDVPLPETFGGLAEIEVDLPLITVTIDTQKMRWGYAGGELGARADSFRDYAGVERYCVEFQEELPVCKVLKHDVVRQAMHLESGEPVYLWAAEVPAEQLAAMSYPSLYELAHNITKKYDGSRATEQLVTIPAVQMKFAREMDEVQGVEAVQKVYMALDETGARVKALTFMAGGLHYEEPKIFHFGERHPVVYWFTENTACSDSQGGRTEHGGIKAMAASRMKAINSAMHSKDKGVHADASKTPFAVIATTTDAWLDPDAKVSFEDDCFE